MVKRHFSTQRLGKLIFWAINIIGGLLAVLGVMNIINYPSFEKTFLQSCDQTREIVKDYICDYGFLNSVENAGFDRLGFGIGIILIYWIIRWIFNYLYPKIQRRT